METPKKSFNKNPFSHNSAKIAELLGNGSRMNTEQKREYLESKGHAFFHNADLVATDTYLELFRGLNLNGKTIVNVGSGYALAGSYNGVTPMVEGLNKIDPDITYIPLDYNHDRSRSWLLLETEKPEENNRINLEPVTGDATLLPFGDETIDGYLSANLINEPRKEQSEVKFVTQMLTEAYRVIKPGGFIVLSSFGYLWYELEDGQIIYNDSVDIEEIVEKEKVLEILLKVGFSEIAELPLNQQEVEAVIRERLERNPKAIRAGIRDACAFFAKK